MVKTIRCISVRQPYASALADLGRVLYPGIINSSRKQDARGPFLLYSPSKPPLSVEQEWQHGVIDALGNLDDLPRGRVVAAGIITARHPIAVEYLGKVVKNESAPGGLWASGPYVYSAVISLRFPSGGVKVKGAVTGSRIAEFFVVDAEKFRERVIKKYGPMAETSVDLDNFLDQ